MRILALETSCDESAAAYLDVRNGRVVRFEHVVMTQEIHAKYGGVVPEVAAREHAVTLPLVIDALAEKVIGNVDGRAFGRKVDIVAATRGPGLVTSLKVGYETGRTLALAWGKKLVGVNHIDGHISSAWLPGAPLELSIDEAGDIFPALVLVVSGGHTELLRMKGHGDFRLLGATRDDAAGEAFDKSAKLMGLGYPGGPALSKLAETGDRTAFPFPRPLANDDNFEFSFSGLKTAVRYFLDEHAEQLNDPTFRANVAASTEEAIVETLVKKTVRAVRETAAKTVILAGGVAANRRLRELLSTTLAKEYPKAKFVVPPLALCTDNAAMIAMAAYFRATQKKFDVPSKGDVDPAWELGR